MQRRNGDSSPPKIPMLDRLSSFSIGPGHGAGAGPSADDVDRMYRNVTALMTELREVSLKIKNTAQFATTKRTFGDWASDLSALATKVDDVVYEFRYAGDAPRAHVAQTPKKFNIADVVSQLKAKQISPELELIPQNLRHDSPRLGASRDSAVLPKPPATSRPAPAESTLPSSPGQRDWKSPQTRRLQTASGDAVLLENQSVTLTQQMAAAVHVTLDSILRSVQATTATIFLPVNGNPAHLEAICDVGRGPDTILAHLNVKDEHSAPCLAAATGIMITVCRGHDPAAEKPQSAEALYNQASVSFRESVRMAMSPHSSNAPRSADTLALDARVSPAEYSTRHAIATPVSGPKRSTVWSSVSVPIRQNSAQKAAAVLHVVNKMGGKANFELEDEHLLYAAANILASILNRVPDVRLLSRMYVPTRPMPPVVQVQKPKAHVRGGGGGGGGSDTEEPTSVTSRSSCGAHTSTPDPCAK
jgi:hypothetical protein